LTLNRSETFYQSTGDCKNEKKTKKIMELGQSKLAVYDTRLTTSFGQ